MKDGCVHTWIHCGNINSVYNECFQALFIHAQNEKLFS